MEMAFVIMAGGSGTRFWPASRRSMPKQLLKIIGTDEMIKLTVGRVQPLVQTCEVIVVINDTISEFTKNALADVHVRLMSEPMARNTAACIGLAAFFLKPEDPDRPMIVLPADHYISDVKAFQETLQVAAGFAAEGDLVTIGVPPNRPETSCGYIRYGEKVGAHMEQSALKIDQFKDKPDTQTALGYLQEGGHLWNTGIFAFKPTVILEEIKQHLPDVYTQLLKIEAAIGHDDYPTILREAYEKMPSISIEHGVMQKTNRLSVVIPATFGWSDIGSWESLYQLREDKWDENQNLAQGHVELVNSRGSFVFNKSKKLVTLFGVEDLVVVDTDDAVLVAKKSEAFRLKDVIDHLKDKNLDKYL